MFAKRLLSDLNLNRNDIVYLVILTVFGTVLTYNMIRQNMILNIKSDTLIYLTNALIYAGMQDNITHTSTIFLSPVICLLTALPLKMGLGKMSIFIVTGILDIIGIIAVYVLLKYRFNRLFSLCGAILFASSTAILVCWADGGLDVSVLSLSIVTMIFFILAVHQNPKYYLLAFPFLVLSIFTKYTAFFMIPLLLLYFLSKYDFFNALDELLSDRDAFKKTASDFIRSDDFRYLCIGLILAVILFAAFCLVITSYGSGLSFITQTNDAVTGFSDSHYASKKDYNLDDSIYFFNFIKIFDLPLDFHGFNMSIFLLIFIIIAISIHLITYVVNSDVIGELTAAKREFRTRHFRSFLTIMLIAFMAILLFGLYFNHMVANIALLTIMVILFSLLDKLDINKKFYSMHFLMLAWFLVYFIFFSKITIKSDRYMINCIPPIVYFVVWSLECILMTIQERFDFKKIFKSTYIDNTTFRFSKTSRGNALKIALIAVTVLLMFGALTFHIDWRYTGHDNKEFNDLYDFLVDYDPDYMSKNISANNSYCARYGTWYLHSNIYFNKTFGVDPVDDYVVTLGELYSRDYDLIYRSGNDLRIYERNY